MSIHAAPLQRTSLSPEGASFATAFCAQGLPRTVRRSSRFLQRRVRMVVDPEAATVAGPAAACGRRAKLRLSSGAYWVLTRWCIEFDGTVAARCAEDRAGYGLSREMWLRLGFRDAVWIIVRGVGGVRICFETSVDVGRRGIGLYVLVAVMLAEV